MKYQVLARKYRPKTFSTIMGQEHVLKALINALETQRLHHAYLFTGTRGVGKTTVARVLARALNCEQGITASPCGTCSACTEIDEGRFVDLIEVDAASRTRVEDTRELLENVQYAPTRGRFKIYLIDEVHMLSGHSFNALLKTLEEPPPHVKFLLATTDPQKLPATILSRCLQFNLKRLSIPQIEQQLQQILLSEQLEYEQAALKPLAIAADGSMRDALSLLDQSIAYSSGRPNLLDVEAMLGCVQKDRVFDLLTTLANSDGAGLIEQSRKLLEQGLEVTTLLAEIITMLQRIALCQQVPDVIDDSQGDRAAVEKMAQWLTPEDVQLYYQIALNGRKDLPYSPHPQGGFEMILLRMLTFRPITSSTHPLCSVVTDATDMEKKTPEQEKKKPVVNAEHAENKARKALARDLEKPLHPVDTKDESGMPESTFFDLPPLDAYAQEHTTSLETEDISVYEYQQSESPHMDAPETRAKTLQTGIPGSQTGTSAKSVKKNIESIVSEHEDPDSAGEAHLTDQRANDWHQLISRCKMTGLEQQLASHCALQSKDEVRQQIVFNLLIEAVHIHLLSDKIQQRIQQRLQELLARPVILKIRQCHKQHELDTPQRREKLEADARQQEAVDSIYNDSRVALLIDSFDAKIIEKSIRLV